MQNPLCQIQIIKSIVAHPNADRLEIAKVLGYECIVKKDEYKEGDIVVFIFPDTVLPDKDWAKVYKAKSGRVKAIKLRGSWSQGIIETFDTVGLNKSDEYFVGMEISGKLGITKYEPPMPQDLSASGPYGFGIPKTDETNFKNLDDLPYGELVDVTLKIDGQSLSVLYKDLLDADGKAFIDQPVVEIGGRSFLFKPDVVNNYTKNCENHGVLSKLAHFCRFNKVNLCIRGEQYGAGIQKSSVNPHSKGPLNLAFFSVWLIDEMRYATKGDKYYIHNIASALDLPAVPVLEKDVVLTKELIQKYDEELSEVNGQPFEGVVINWKGGSFKVINKSYDSKK